MSTVQVFNLTAVGQSFGGMPSGSTYTVGNDGTVTVDMQDIGVLTMLGFQLNAANPLRVPFLGYYTDATVDLPIGACALVANPDEDETTTVNLPPAALCPGSFYYIGYGAAAAGTLAITPNGADTINGATGASGSPGIYYSDGVNNFIPFAI